MKIIYSLFIFIFISACSSGPSKPSEDICSVKKHWQDNVFQVAINGDVLSKHFYLYEDAIAITKNLVIENKCKDRAYFK